MAADFPIPTLIVMGSSEITGSVEETAFSETIHALIVQKFSMPR